MRLADIIAETLHEHRVDWANTEIGVYPCVAGDFAHDSPDAWIRHQAEAVAARLGIEPQIVPGAIAGEYHQLTSFGDPMFRVRALESESQGTVGGGS